MSSLYADLHVRDPEPMLDEAMRVNVIFATPSSLVALLKTVAFGWKQAVLAQNADEVRRLGEEQGARQALLSFGELEPEPYDEP